MNILSVAAITEIAVRAQARHEAIAGRQRALLAVGRDKADHRAPIALSAIREFSANPERENNLLLAQVCTYRRYWPVANDSVYGHEFPGPAPQDPSYA